MDIRISAASQNRILTRDRRFLLSVNNKGEHNLTPIGGGLEFSESARPFLTGLGARFGEGNDLRLTINQARVAEFERWFVTRTGRETDSFREVQQELVDEEHVLAELLPEQVMANYVWTSKPPIALSSRPGAEGTLTQRYFEVFDLQFVSTVWDKIGNNMASANPIFALATPEEIMAGRTENTGQKIGDNCKALLGLFQLNI